MAEADETEDKPGIGDKLASLKVHGPLLLAAFNSLVALGLVGLMFYIKMVYKRPAITEDGERMRLTKMHEKKMEVVVPGLIAFEPITVNIAAQPPNPKPADGTARQLAGKLHYATVGFALELRDAEQKDMIESLRPVIIDRMLNLLGHKAFHELTTPQGRYVLRSQILDLTNQMTHGTLVSNVYFTEFTVQ